MSFPEEGSICAVCDDTILFMHQDLILRHGVKFHVECLNKISVCVNCKIELYLEAKQRCLVCCYAIPRLMCSKCQTLKTDGIVRLGLFICQDCEKTKEQNVDEGFFRDKDVKI